jgi:SpoIIAA-like
MTRDEYREMMKPIYAALERGEKLNIYFELDDDFDGLDLGALWEDMKAAGSVGLKHRSSWQKMALITDKDWIRHAAAVFGPLAPGELRIFAEDASARKNRLDRVEVVLCHTSRMFSRMNTMPIKATSGASRGALRNGRKAVSSTRPLITAESAAAAASISANTSSRFVDDASERPPRRAMEAEIIAPKMKTSP